MRALRQRGSEDRYQATPAASLNSLHVPSGAMDRELQDSATCLAHETTGTAAPTSAQPISAWSQPSLQSAQWAGASYRAALAQSPAWGGGDPVARRACPGARHTSSSSPCLPPPTDPVPTAGPQLRDQKIFKYPGKPLGLESLPSVGEPHQGSPVRTFGGWRLIQESPRPNRGSNGPGLEKAVNPGTQLG